MGWFKQALALPPELAQAIASEGRLLDWASHSEGLLAVTKDSLVEVSGNEVTITPWTDSLQAKWEPPYLTVIFQGPQDQKQTEKSLQEESPQQVEEGKTQQCLEDQGLSI
jgi:hypothetical protein